MIGKTVEHYEILEQLGSGGMGVVYKAMDTKLDRIVALKFLPAAVSSDPDVKERFIQEAKAASSLDDPHICTIHDIAESEDGQLFIVMAFYDGDTLKYRIDRTTMDVAEACGIARQMALSMLPGSESSPFDRLSQREMQVMLMVTDGSTWSRRKVGPRGPSTRVRTGGDGIRVCDYIAMRVFPSSSMMSIAMVMPI